MFETKSIDNSSILVKLMLRKSLLDLKAVEKTVALDLFAGTGEIASRVYSGFPELHLVERDCKKFARLGQKFKSDPRSRLWNMDNLEFIRSRLQSIPEVSVADFDAYASPNLQLLAFFENWKVSKPLLIFATDGITLSRLRGRSFNPGLYLAGPDQGSGRGHDPVITRNCELMIRSFWSELSRRHNFRICLFKILWKKMRQVAYYGLWIEPR